MKHGSQNTAPGFPARYLVLALPLFALAAWAGMALALWQVPPESLEEPLPLPVGSTVPVAEGQPVAASPDASDLRDYHFTRAVGGDWRSYLDSRRVELLEAPTRMKILDFDADLARIQLPAPAGEAPREVWVSESRLLSASRRQRGLPAEQ